MHLKLIREEVIMAKLPSISIPGTSYRGWQVGNYVVVDGLKELIA